MLKILLKMLTYFLQVNLCWHPSQRVALIKYTLAAPLFLVLIFAFALPNSPLMSSTEGVSRGLEAAINLVETKVNNTVQNIDNPIVHLGEKPILNTTVSSDLPSLPAEIVGGDTLRLPSFTLSNPMVRLAGRANGLVSKETFLNQSQLALIQPTSEYPVICAIQSFILIRVPLGSKLSQEARNTGGKFNAETLQLIQQAQEGDAYQFVQIKGRCPGDRAARDLGNTTFTIGENKEDKLRNELHAAYMMDVEMAKKASLAGNCGMKEGDTGRMPTFPGGDEEVSKFIYSNLQYPEDCKKAGREAVIVVNYTITEEGFVTDVKHWTFKWANPHISPSSQSFVKLEPEDQPMADEAVRVIRSMPRWKPGTRNGVISCHSQSFRVKFKLK